MIESTLFCSHTDLFQTIIMPPAHYRVKVTSSLEIEASVDSPSLNNFATNAVRSPPSLPGFLRPAPRCVCVTEVTA